MARYSGRQDDGDETRDLVAARVTRPLEPLVGRHATALFFAIVVFDILFVAFDSVQKDFGLLRPEDVDVGAVKKRLGDERNRPSVDARPIPL